MPDRELTARAPLYDSAHRPAPFVDELLELSERWDLVRLWTRRNITLRYKRSVLGVFWTLLEPLMLTIILTIVFSTAFRFPIPRYPVYLLSGLLLFDFLSRSTLQISEEIIASGNLSQRIHFPRSAFALAAVLSYLFNWFVALLPLFALVLVLGQPLTPAVLTLPLGIALTALFSLGVGLIVASVSAHFHDFKLAYQVLLTGWLYATPIIYPIEVIPARARPFFELNPLYYLVRLVRDPVYLGQVSAPAVWAIGAVAALATAVAGWWIFTRARSAFEYSV